MLRGPFFWLAIGVAVLVAPAQANAVDRYDRRLEQAMKAMAASKMGPLRGSLEREFKPLPTSEEPPAQTGLDLIITSVTGSILRTALPERERQSLSPMAELALFNAAAPPDERVTRPKPRIIPIPQRPF